MTDQQDAEQQTTEPRRRFGPRQVVGLLLIALFVVFLLENTRRVTVRLIIPEERISLSLALLATGLLGAIGLLLVQYRRRHR